MNSTDLFITGQEDQLSMSNHSIDQCRPVLPSVDTVDWQKTLHCIMVLCYQSVQLSVCCGNPADLIVAPVLFVHGHCEVGGFQDKRLGSGFQGPSGQWAAGPYKWWLMGFDPLLQAGFASEDCACNCCLLNWLPTYMYLDHQQLFLPVSGTGTERTQFMTQPTVYSV